MTIRAVFFDAGGTLVEPHPSVGEVYGGVAARLGHPADPALVESAWRSAWTAYQRQARAGDLPLPRSDAEDHAMWIRITRMIYDGVTAFRGLDFDRWFDGIHAAFTGAACWRVFPEAPGVIEACRARGLRCGVVSNWGSYLCGILRDHGIADRMDVLLVSAQEGCIKPEPEIFRRAVARAGVAPHEALHVGDSARDDAVGASSAGLRGVFLDRCGGADAPPGTPVVRDLRGILDHLDP
jgi:putative hydrolase of the HAD superfamily